MEEYKKKLEILENRLNTKFNYTLISLVDINEEIKNKDNYIFRHSTSRIHNTNYLINYPFYKIIHQPFIIKSDD